MMRLPVRGHGSNEVAYTTRDDCNTDRNQEGKQLQHTQIFDPQHKTDVHECDVCIMLLSGGFSGKLMKIDKESN